MVMSIASTAMTSTADASTLGYAQPITARVPSPTVMLDARDLDATSFLQRYYARQHLQGMKSATTPDASEPPAEPDEPNSLLRCSVPQEGVMPQGNFNYAERGQSWLLANGPAICGSRDIDTSGTLCFAQRNASINPWTFYVVYGSTPQTGPTQTFGRAVSSCTYGPGKKILQRSPEPGNVQCGSFAPNKRLGNYSDIKDGGYAPTLAAAQARCNAIATPEKGYCIAYRNEGTTGDYIILMGGDHPTNVNWNGTEGWVSRCQ